MVCGVWCVVCGVWVWVWVWGVMGLGLTVQGHCVEMKAGWGGSDLRALLEVEGRRGGRRARALLVRHQRGRARAREELGQRVREPDHREHLRAVAGLGFGACSGSRGWDLGLMGFGLRVDVGMGWGPWARWRACARGARCRAPPCLRGEGSEFKIHHARVLEEVAKSQFSVQGS